MSHPPSSLVADPPVHVVAPPAGAVARRGRGLLTGGAAGGLVALGVQSGLLVGWPAVLLLLLGLAAVPSAGRLSPRLATNGAILLGATPLLWWSVWPLPVSHGAAVLGGTAFGLATWVSGAADWRTRLAGLRPTVTWADGVPLGTGVVTLLALTRFWWNAGDSRSALLQLLPGWDAAAHVGIFGHMWVSGTTLAGAPQEFGRPWAYENYPAGYHAVAATFGDLLVGPAGGPAAGPAEMLRAYCLSLVLVVVLGAVVVAGALASVRAARDHPWIAAAASALSVGALVLGPGAVAIADGFAPFWYAEALLAACLLLAATSPVPLSVVRMAAVGAAVVGIAQSWAPLCLLTVPALIGALAPWSQLVGRGRRWWLGASLVTLLTLVGTAPVALTLVSTVQVGILVEAVGGFSPTAPLPLLGVLVATCLVLGVCGRRRTPGAGAGAGATSDVSPHRFRTLLWVPLVGLLAAGALLSGQLRNQGRPDYYFFKFVSGVEFACLPLLALGLVLLLARETERRPVAVPVRAGVVVVAALVAVTLQPWNDSGPRAIVDATASRNGTADLRAGMDPAAVVAAITTAAQDSGRVSDQEALVTFAPAALSQAALPQSWFLSLTRTYTDRAALVARDLPAGTIADDGILADVREVVEKHPRAVVLVAPDRVEQVRASLGSEELARRVRAY